MAIYYVAGIPYGQTGELYHYGRKGMKWGENIFTKWKDAIGRFNNRLASNMQYNAQQRSNARAQNLAYNQRNQQNRADNYNRDVRARYEADTARAQAARPSGLSGAFDRLNKQRADAMARAHEMATTAYSKAASKVGEAGKNIHAFYSDVMSKAKAQISRGAALVRKFGGTLVDSIKNMGERALAGGKSFLQGIFGRISSRKEKRRRDEEYTRRNNAESAANTQRRNAERDAAERNRSSNSYNAQRTSNNASYNYPANAAMRKRRK